MRFVAWTLPWAILGILLTGVSAFYIVKPDLLQNSQNELRTLGAEVSRAIADQLRQHAETAQTLSETPLFADYFNNRRYGLAPEAESYRHEIERYFGHVLDREKELDGLWLVDADEKPIVGLTRGLPAEQVQDILRVRTSWHVVQTSPSPALVQSKALALPVGSAGRLVVAHTLEPIGDLLSSVIRRGHLHATLLTKKGEPLFRSSAGGSAGDEMEQRFEVKGAPWILAISADRAELLKPLVRIQYITVFFSVLSAIVVAAIIVFQIRRLLRPIHQLKLVVDRFRVDGVLAGPVETSRDEIGSLRDSFFNMAEALQKEQEQVERSELTLRSTLDASVDAIIGLDGGFHILTWNRGAERLFRVPQEGIVGKPLQAALAPDVVAALVNQALSQGIVRRFETEIPSAGGKPRLAHLTLAGAGSQTDGQRFWTLVLRDVTEEKAMQAQLVQAEKLGVVGTLLSGVAHEINNPLTTVVGLSDLLLRETKSIGDQLRKDLDTMRLNALRCRDIVAGLLRFVRKGKLEKRLVSVNDTVESVLKLMEYRLAKRDFVQVDKDLDRQIGLVSADAPQLEQVFVNLIQNACDAMSDQKRPKQLIVRTFRYNNGVGIDVADNGPGISAAVRERIFEPFFTTKEEGKGTGLGLAISQRIIADHQGTLSVSSVEGEGTRFTIWLPVFSKTSPASGADRERPSPMPAKKRILVIDDEEMIVEFLSRALTSEGHQVVAVTNAEEALRHAAQGSFDLCVSDVAMPSVKGYELPQKMAERNGLVPSKFLFITGDIQTAELPAMPAGVRAAVLQKPFNINELRNKIRELDVPAGEGQLPAR